jgi:hypothetical protein
MDVLNTTMNDDAFPEEVTTKSVQLIGSLDKTTNDTADVAVGARLLTHLKNSFGIHGLSTKIRVEQIAAATQSFQDALRMFFKSMEPQEID